MAYRVDGKDIVISGFEKGIAESPYKGVSDMRNIDIISVPGEASVAFAPTLTTTQTPITNAPFTVDPATEIFTWAGGTTLANNTAVTFTNSGGSLPTGLSANTAYYIVNATATTFQLSVDGSNNSCASGGSIKNITGAGSGTNTFSTINIAQPKYIREQKYVDTTNNPANPFLYFGLDSNGRCWYYYNQSQWVYMNNLNGENSAGNPESGNGLEAWKNTLFNFRQQNIAVILTNVIATGVPQTLAYLTTFGNWNLTWQSITGNGYGNAVSHFAFSSPTSDALYFCNAKYIGSILENAGSVFDPATSSTYTYNATALSLPTYEVAQCIDQLGTNLLIGGIFNIIYSWDRISVGYNPIFIAENNTARIVAVNQNAYAFSGQRGRIYIINGSQAQLYKKIPDHLSGTTNPYYTWGDALANRNQLYFGIQATDNSGTAINQYGGTWAIDLDSKSLRLVTQQSYGSYAGITSALCSIQGNGTGNGYGMLMGWYTSSNTTGGIDKSSSSAYSGGQSYVDSDLIPIGTILKPFTPSQVEWKTSVPIGSGGTSETVALYYRTNFNDSYTLINSTTSATGLLTGGAPSFSDYYTTNFQNAQWVQIRSVLTSNATTPTYCRLTELRIRDYIKN